MRKVVFISLRDFPVEDEAAQQVEKHGNVSIDDKYNDDKVYRRGIGRRIPVPDQTLI
jgi:hypothetical protein